MIYVLNDDGSAKVYQSHTEVKAGETSHCRAVLPFNPKVYTLVELIPALYNTAAYMKDRTYVLAEPARYVPTREYKSC